MLSLKRTAAPLSEEDSLAAHAAWLHYSGGFTQSEVAKRLGITQPKAHRLISRAFKQGLITVLVDPSIQCCIDLEDSLTANYGLEFCQVVPDLNEDGLPLRALGLAGAGFLRRIIESEQYKTIGIGHGRTLASMVHHLPAIHQTHTRFVSLLGGLTRKFAANPLDVIHRLAEKTDAEAYMLPVSIFANSAQDKETLMRQPGIADVFDMGREADLLIISIGEANWHSHLSEVNLVTKEEMHEIQALNAQGELLGHYFDAEGEPVKTSLNERAMSLSVDELRGKPLVALAGGVSKVPALKAVLKSGLMKGLITDDVTAKQLLSDQ
ncbi:DNA-binding transcriptional regulator LsrR, DeoR family [Enterovibrio nigricans DSM 22720]|uniref:DNA-binding transcriptional regulator LsrR, DeoR family n=1 Tax=Enterovibrio nigricans DSM 22720 TaxID=1121868 RepID=A0A1T4UCE6_9GAMM|nr:DNA-binding transcriptional regulator LsrR, DeoR family [Enterovibrio nigricans DSM 22720]